MEVRLQALRLLDKAGAPDVTSFITGGSLAYEIPKLFLAKDAPDELVWRALALYNQIGFPNSSHLGRVEELVKAASSWELRRTALEALGERGAGKQHHDLVFDILRAPRHPDCNRIDGCHPEVWRAALLAAADLRLPWSKEPTADFPVTILIRHLADCNEPVRLAAVKAYLASDATRINTLPTLIERLDLDTAADADCARGASSAYDTQTTVHEKLAILEIFRQLGPLVKNREAILKFIEDDDGRVRVAAFLAADAIEPWPELSLLGYARDPRWQPKRPFIERLMPGEQIVAGSGDILRSILRDREASTDDRVASIDLLIKAELVASSRTELEDVLAESDEVDPTGSLRAAALRALVSPTREGTPGVITTRYRAQVDALIRDPDMGLETIRAVLPAAYWNGRSADDEALQPLFDLLEDGAADPLVRTKAFEMITEAPSASIAENPNIQTLIEAQLQSREPEAHHLRTAVLRFFASQPSIIYRHLDLIVRLLDDSRQDDALADVRTAAASLVARHANRPHHLEALLDALEDENSVTYDTVVEALLDVRVQDATDLSLVFNAGFTHPDRRAQLTALAHILGQGDEEAEALIGLLRFDNGHSTESLLTKGRWKRAYQHLHKIVMSQPYRRGRRQVTPSGSDGGGLISVASLSSEMRSDIHRKLESAVDEGRWFCWNLGSLEDLHDRIGTLQVAGVISDSTSQDLVVTLEGKLYDLNDSWLCRFLSLFDLGTLVGRAFWGIIVFIVGATIVPRFKRAIQTSREGTGSPNIQE